MPLFVQHFGERQVKTRFALWTGLHRRTKACPSRLRAIDCHDKGRLPPRDVGRILILSSGIHTILNEHRLDLTSPHADERKPGLLVRRRLNLDQAVFTRSAPKPLLGWIEKSLPGLRANVVAKQRRIIPRDKPILAGCLLIGQPLGQVLNGMNRFVTDRAIACDWSNDLEALLAQSIKQLIEPEYIQQQQRIRLIGRTGHCGIVAIYALTVKLAVDFSQQ